MNSQMNSQTELNGEIEDVYTEKEYNSGDEIVCRVTINDRVPDQSFTSKVEGLVSGWMASQGLNTENPDYQVAIFEEDHIGEVSCLIVVQAGERLWRSWESSDHLLSAIRQSLKCLKEQGTAVPAPVAH